MHYLTGRPLDECVFDSDGVRRIFEHKAELGRRRLLFSTVYRGLPFVSIPREGRIQNVRSS
ncbi:hypothetical protein D3C86_2072880 [compost metagenome]